MWPTSQIAATSAANVWNQLCQQAANLKTSAAALRARAADGAVTEPVQTYTAQAAAAFIAACAALEAAVG